MPRPRSGDELLPLLFLLLLLLPLQVLAMLLCLFRLVLLLVDALVRSPCFVAVVVVALGAVSRLVTTSRTTMSFFRDTLLSVDFDSSIATLSMLVIVRDIHTPRSKSVWTCVCVRERERERERERVYGLVPSRVFVFVGLYTDWPTHTHRHSEREPDG